ncbi:EF-hand calcium-binding domain-containing protein 9-like [Histomonas meleagridis]|uniref:EF-hand calcium-binding domain-containing protein 9-like n=1 Tax=Histomonas meleagridis TaxID=135588 RepID=UPI00355AB18C|nr:EF-hand calcium-binding domain-containing protein 9-like [Histomonas meleagridis]KAH0801503.1 EF-hand calcium-binding domain-containing protein 9-like [Histomonas meleagridis]
MHLVPPAYTLSAKDFQVVHKIYDMLNFNHLGLDDVVFGLFVSSLLEGNSEAHQFLFDLFDTDGSNRVEFDEFYLLILILVALKDNQAIPFFAQNTRVCFDLLDIESMGMITMRQAVYLSVLLNIDKKIIDQKFIEFDTSNNNALEFDEFELFIMSVLDNTQSTSNKKSKRELANQHLEEKRAMSDPPKKECILI